MVTNEDVDVIINIWSEEWRNPLAKSLPEEQNAEEPLLHQVNGEEHEGDDKPDDQSQEHNEENDDINDLEHHELECLPSQEHVQKQMHAQQGEGHSSRKKQKYDRIVNMSTLTEDDVQKLADTVAKVTQDNLSSIRMQQLIISTQVKGHLNKLIEAIQDVKATMEAKTYGQG